MVNVVVRSLSVIVLGVLMVVLREQFLPVIIQFIGAAFVVSGVIALFNLYVIAKRGMSRVLDTVVLGAAGSAGVILGAWLLLSPGFFLSLVMTILGVLLLLSGIYQLALLLGAHRRVGVSGYLYIVPVALVVAGVFVIVNPFGAAGLPFLLVGVGAVFAGLSDIVSYFYLLHRRRVAGSK